MTCVELRAGRDGWPMVSVGGEEPAGPRSFLFDGQPPCSSRSSDSRWQAKMRSRTGSSSLWASLESASRSVVSTRLHWPAAS